MEFITLLLVEKKYFTVREQQKLIDVSINGICIEHYIQLFYCSHEPIPSMDNLKLGQGKSICLS